MVAASVKARPPKLPVSSSMLQRDCRTWAIRPASALLPDFPLPPDLLRCCLLDMSALRLQLRPQPPPIGGGWVRKDCTQRLSSCTLQSCNIAANSVSFTTKDCRSWAIRATTALPPPDFLRLNPEVEDFYPGMTPNSFTAEDFRIDTTLTIEFHKLALLISLGLLLLSIVVEGALVALLLHLGKGTHNLVVYSGDITVLSIASLNSVSAGVALFLMLSLLVSLAIYGHLVLLRIIEANKNRIYRLWKEAEAKSG